MGQALHRLAEEDPTLHIGRDPVTGETIVSGLGEPHVQIALERMTRRFGVNVDVGLPRVAYRETISAKTVAEYKHKKQTGGAGQYGHVFLELEPLPDADFEFAETGRRRLGADATSTRRSRRACARRWRPARSPATRSSTST